MNTPSPAEQPTREVVLVTGISGSGKSVALHALEDAGYFCVDNLPPELLREFVRLEHARGTHRVAVAVDVRAARSLSPLVPLMDEMRGEGILVRALFLDSTTDALVRRFSETRRPHPLSNPSAASDNQTALVEAIELERLLLGELREVSTVIDTSQLRPADLRAWVRRLVQARHAALTLVLESFAFKFGVPLDADFVFDVRVLPNPYYIRELRALTGA
ncbi:MAG TPA: RNase adapter RapZ, partial [Burkholderiaceae bacterium]|nr:RNase adapter RapZ [Burkholderiaceae bacterium]